MVNTVSKNKKVLNKQIKAFTYIMHDIFFPIENWEET